LNGIIIYKVYTCRLLLGGGWLLEIIGGVYPAVLRFTAWTHDTYYTSIHNHINPPALMVPGTIFLASKVRSEGVITGSL
jgi:hypothetical protein